MQMLAVKLGVATGLNLAQQCRYCAPPFSLEHFQQERSLSL